MWSMCNKLYCEIDDSNASVIVVQVRPNPTQRPVEAVAVNRAVHIHEVSFWTLLYTADSAAYTSELPISSSTLDEQERH